MRWTPEDDAQLLAGMPAGNFRPFLEKKAEEMGRTYTAVRVRLERLRGCRDEGGRADTARIHRQLIDRKCLHCSKPFIADGRFIRICTPCKEGF